MWKYIRGILNIKIILNQFCPTRGPWAVCSPVEDFVWTSRSFLLLCTYNIMTTCLYFDNLKYDILMQWSLVLVYHIPYPLVDFHVSTDTSVQN